MGVPKFFRWVAERYPLVITPFKDSPPPVDNLYLDMNGIIHQCTHPNDIDASRKSATEREMVEAMFAYLEKLFAAIQPRKHFFLAVDGCAPRAKMNQQRQRRYRAGYEMMTAREEALKMGMDVPDEGDVFDSNCITPGTEFMVRISEHFEYFITMKLQQDSAWRNCKIIFSGQDEPGEGEHKIVDFVRRRKMQPDYDPNETHCMYGLDADLIMLALATHEPHFILLREVVTFNGGSKKDKERKAEDALKGILEDPSYKKPDSFVLFHINILREYLDIEMRRGETFPHYDLERVLDDFVFMCFFIGNDFLPSIPTLSINDGGMLTMINLYRELCLSKGTNLVRNGKPNWNTVEVLLTKIGDLELEVLKQRQEEELEYQKRAARNSDSHELPVPPIPITNMAEYKERFYREKHGFEGWRPRGQEMYNLRQHFIEGLLWVMEYYYQGPPSWKWFYPHHYALLASDMINLTLHGNSVKFDKGEPFLPHQQLLAVLPPMSYRSMPKAYWPLLRAPTSPLMKYFPRILQIDREGARAPWEGTVLIPFIDERELIVAYNSVQDQVGEIDKKRNQNRTALLFEFDMNIEPYTVQNDMFKPLFTVRVNRQPFHYPPMQLFVPALCQGVRMGPQHIEGFASLASCADDLSPSYEMGAVNIFGMPSRKESLLLNFSEGEAASAEGLAYALGQPAWIGFPHFKRCRVSAVVDRRKRLTAKIDKDGNFMGQLVIEDLSGEDYRAFKKEADTHAQYLKAKCGLVLPSVDVLVYVHRFTGMRLSRKGRFVHQYSTKESCYPLQLLRFPDKIDMLEDPKNQERDREAFDFQSGNEVLYVGPDPKNHNGESIYGSMALVVDRKEEGDTYSLLLRQHPDPLPIPAAVAAYGNTGHWMSIGELCDKVRAKVHMKVSPHTLSQITGTISTSAQFGSQELGLCMKFTAKNLARVGYAKLVQTHYNPWYVGNNGIFERMETDAGHHMATAGKEQGAKGAGGAHSGRGQWYFSQQAFEIIATYCEKFRPLVERVEVGGINSNQFDVPSILTGAWQDRGADEVLREITQWISTNKFHELPMISATDDAFSADIIAELEKALQAGTPRKTEELRLKKVHGRQIFFPDSRLGTGLTISVPLPKEQRFALGNRVVACRTTGMVPFGLTGTVVRLLGDGQTAEIVFDESFIGGSHLGGRLKTSRGALVKLSSLLLLDKEAAPPRAQATKNTPAQPTTADVLAKLPMSPLAALPGASVIGAPTVSIASNNGAGISLQAVDDALRTATPPAMQRPEKTETDFPVDPRSPGKTIPLPRSKNTPVQPASVPKKKTVVVGKRAKNHQSKAVAADIKKNFDSIVADLLKAKYGQQQ